MKKCKSCKKSIDNKASKCSYCQTDQRNWFRKHPVITAILVVFVFVIIGSSSGDGSSDSSSSTPEQKQAEQAKVYAVDEVVTSKKMELTVTSVSEKTSVGGQYFSEKASEGGVLVVVNWQYKNTSDEPIGSFSQPNIELMDSNGVVYSSDGGKTIAYATQTKLDSKMLSDLNPGITVKDAEVFEVSKENYAQGDWYVIIKADGKEYRVVTK